MPRICTICRHPRRAEIDQALVAEQASLRDIARRFGATKDSLSGHRPHIPAALVKSKQAAEIAQADSLVDQLKSLQEKSLNILEKAETAGDLRTALAGIREARANFELLARLTGEMARVEQGLPKTAILILPPTIPAGGRPAEIPVRRLPPELSAPTGDVIDIESEPAKEVA